MKDFKPVSVRGIIILMIVLLNAIVVKNGFLNDSWYWALVVTIPLLLVVVVDTIQSKNVNIQTHN